MARTRAQRSRGAYQKGHPFYGNQYVQIGKTGRVATRTDTLRRARNWRRAGGALAVGGTVLGVLDVVRSPGNFLSPGYLVSMGALGGSIAAANRATMYGRSARSPAVRITSTGIRPVRRRRRRRR